MTGGFYLMLVFSPGQCNAGFHGAAQEVAVLAHAGGGSPGLDGRGRTAGQMPSSHPQGNTKAPRTATGTSLHQNLPLIYSL